MFSTLHRQVTIVDIKINPWTLSATATGVSVSDAAKNNDFASFDELYIHAGFISSLV